MDFLIRVQDQHSILMSIMFSIFDRKWTSASDDLRLHNFIFPKSFFIKRMIYSVSICICIYQTKALSWVTILSSSNISINILS